MACFYQAGRNMLVLQCDVCKTVVDIYRGETDRLLANYYIRENGWKATKINGKWMQLCPECKKAMETKRREKFMAQI